MPVMTVSAIAKHLLGGLIPDWTASCQTYVSQDVQDLPDAYLFNPEKIL
jgi:hypothetical protein